MNVRHASEVAAQKAVWRQLAADREKVWSDYRKEFAIPEVGRTKPASSDLIARSSRKPPRDHGRAKPENERRADRIRKNGADHAPPAEKSSRRDWRARRSAAERKADGSYKKRDRDNDGSGRGRERDRYDRD